MLRRLLLLAAPTAAAALAVMLTLQGFTPDGVAVEEAVKRPRYTVGGAEWTRYGEDGNADFRARALRIDYFDDHSLALGDVTLDRLEGDAGPWTLRAAQGEVPPGANRMRLTPDVDINGKLRSGARADIQTRNVWVDWRAKTLTSAEPILMQSPGRELRAIGFESDWSGEHVRFMKQVQVHYAPPT